ncbi:MAG TPA: SDR family NAD(P)-dependent oxidoreductase [Pseudolabrys sp.]|nr:SDR family NAD(P)-dependent oxidoreductase [Pseudolabrys sp.]
MDLDLKGRVAVVTGAATGIGEAIARTLAREGCTVCIADRDADGARKAVTAVGGHAVTLDVGDANGVAKAFEGIVETHKRLDILVNAAGLLSTGKIADLPTSEWDRVAQVNLSGLLYCVKAAIPAMQAQRHGRIINIASISAMRGGGSLGNVLYGTTKAGVVALTMGLARELGPFGITANAIAPAVVETAMTQKSLTDEARARITARIPLGRLASTDDVADLAAFLASDRASFISGTTIPVDGAILTT